MKLRQSIFLLVMLIGPAAYSQYGRLHLSASMGPAKAMGSIRHVDGLNPEVHADHGASFNLGIDFDVSKQFGTSLYLAGDFFEVDYNNDFSSVYYSDWVASWAIAGVYYHHSWFKRLRVQAGVQLGLMGLQTPYKVESHIDNNGISFHESDEHSGRTFGFGLQAKGSYYPLKFLGIFINTQLMHATPEFSYGKQPFTSTRLELGLETRFIN